MGQIQLGADLLDARRRVEALEARMDVVDGGGMAVRLDALEKMGEEILAAMRKPTSDVPAP